MDLRQGLAALVVSGGTLCGGAVGYNGLDSAEQLPTPGDLIALTDKSHEVNDRVRSLSNVLEYCLPPKLLVRTRLPPTRP